jgi:hypothetical protein
LLEDAGLALLLTLVLISFTAGLGALALLEIPLAGGLVASLAIERRRRRHGSRRRRSRPGARR